ncbi:hypothetical protein [Actinocorallia herbida]|uniref:hypothetical protein n=1 Tax=Actinocorallia herbida TaxID=58109 RepID=UPI000F4BEE21|nr:hypothetical protein [Actinocorallia herbida]
MEKGEEAHRGQGRGLAADRPGDAAFPQRGAGRLPGEPVADQGGELVAGEQGEGGGVLVVADERAQVPAQRGEEAPLGQPEPVDELPRAEPPLVQSTGGVPGVPGRVQLGRHEVGESPVHLGLELVHEGVGFFGHDTPPR